MVGLKFPSSHQTLLFWEVTCTDKLRHLSQKLTTLIKQADVQLFGYVPQQRHNFSNLLDG